VKQGNGIFAAPRSISHPRDLSRHQTLHAEYILEDHLHRIRIVAYIQRRIPDYADVSVLQLFLGLLWRQFQNPVGLRVLLQLQKCEAPIRMYGINLSHVDALARVASLLCLEV
jgi:hypothetical protein